MNQEPDSKPESAAEAGAGGPTESTPAPGVGSAAEADMIDKILGDGRAQADRALENARRSAESEKRKVEAEAEKARQEILDRAARKVKALKSKDIATADIESKRLLLRAREQAILKVFGTIEAQLAAVREKPSEYKEALRSLAVEAVAAIAMPEVVLRVAKQDAALVDDAFVADVTELAAQCSRDDIRITLDLDPAVSGGGCVAASPDGRIVFDNTFRRRLERMKPTLRSLIAKEVLKGEY